METIWAEDLFALNFIIDYFTLLCSARVSGAVIDRRRLALGALLGGAYAVISLLPSLQWLSSPPLKLSFALLMCLSAFGGQEKLFRKYITFLAVSCAFGGAVWASSMLAGYGAGGRIYVPVSLRVLLLSFAVCWAAVSLVFRRMDRRAERHIVMLTIMLNEKTVSLQALRDTGNGLCDPVSGREAAVCEAGALAPLLPPEAVAVLKNHGAAEAVTALAAMPGQPLRFTLLPCRTVGRNISLLPAFRPDKAEADGHSVDIIIAVTPGPLSEDGGYNAIL